MRRRRSLIATALSCAALAVAGVTTPGSASADSGYFTGAAPAWDSTAGADCANWIGSQPIRENKGSNSWFNGRTGYELSGAEYPMTLVKGEFTGTTEQILRWGACKWGADPNAVMAQAVIESWWHQDNRGAAHGILQVQQDNNQWAYPGVSESTAMNVDYTLARLRECEMGEWTWLNDVERGWNYDAGDSWGCVGVWATGRWHTRDAETYIGRVKEARDQQTWRTPNFQQP